MSQTLKELCGTLNTDELKAAIFAYWSPQSPDLPTSINYTFDLSSTFDSLKNSVNFITNDETINETSHSLQESIKNILGTWETACGNFIQFNQVPHLEKGQGIVFAACDNMADNTHGLATYQTKLSLDNTTAFIQVLVCLPSSVKNNFDLQTISHEIGHALGFKHLHDIDSVKKRLEKTPQGLGCSVMPYPAKLTSTINSCNTAQFCLDQDYAVLPGPLDAEMCQVLYHKQATKLKNTQTNYYTALLYGAFNGLLENSIYHYCTNLQINDDKLLSPHVAKRLTIALATYSRYYFDIGNHYVNIPLSLLSIFSQEGNFPYHEEIETCRLLLSIIGLGTSIYSSFDEEWSYLLFITAASILADIGGRMLGGTLGISLASTTNKLINYTSKALSSTSDYITSAYNYGLSFWPTSEDDEKISKEGIKQVNKSKYL